MPAHSAGLETKVPPSPFEEASEKGRIARGHHKALQIAQDDGMCFPFKR